MSFVRHRCFRRISTINRLNSLAPPKVGSFSAPWDRGVCLWTWLGVVLLNGPEVLMVKG